MAVSEHKRVLVVEDDDGMRQLLQDVLTGAGYECDAVADGLMALSYLASGHEVDLVFSDIGMPGISGIDLLRTVKAITPTTPVVLLSGQYEMSLGLDAMLSGAADYLYKPVKPQAVVEMAQRHLGPNVRRSEKLLQETLARFFSANGGEPLKTEQVLELFDILGLKRYETMQHSRRVSAYSLLVGRSYGLGEPELEDLRVGALLHDVGKIAIPHNVLMKPGPLNDEEWVVMRMHPQLGAELLSGFPQLKGPARVVRCHHERYDGAGYPEGLSEERIPVGARIFSLVDTFDAMVSDRPYRKGRPVAEARAEIATLAGTHLDPVVRAAFDGVSDLEISEIRRRFADEPAL